MNDASARTQPSLESHSVRDDGFGPKERCRVDHGFCPLEGFPPEEIEHMQIPDALGPSSGPESCLGLAGTLLREHRDGLDGRDGFLHTIGIGDGHHRARIHDILLEKGIDLNIYNVKPGEQGAMPRQNDRSPQSRTVAPSGRPLLPCAWKHMHRSYTVSRRQRTPISRARGSIEMAPSGSARAGDTRPAVRQHRGRQVARPETFNIARLESAFEDCFWSKDISGGH